MGAKKNMEGRNRNFKGSRRDSRRSKGKRFGGSDRRSGGYGGHSGGGFRPRNNFRSGPREMHKATCAECGQECEVPFKPSGERPVYCKECFQKRRPKRF